MVIFHSFLYVHQMVYIVGQPLHIHSGKGLDTITVTGNVLRFWDGRDGLGGLGIGWRF